MNCNTDWNSRLLPRMRECTASADDALDLFEYLNDRFSITRFCLMPLYDAELEPLSVFLLRRARAESELKELLPRDKKIKLQTAACVQITKNLHQIIGLEKLCLEQKKYLPIRLPICTFDSWIDFEINHLLYHSPTDKLLFMSFELAVILYPNEIIEKLLRISNAAFQFNFKAFSNPEVQKIICKLLRQNRLILMGTGMDCAEKAIAYDLNEKPISATDILSDADIQTLFRRSDSFWKK